MRVIDPIYQCDKPSHLKTGVPKYRETPEYLRKEFFLVTIPLQHPGLNQK